MRRISTSAAIGLIAFLAGWPRAVAEDSPLSIADLEAYRVALNSKASSPAPTVGFRDLWDRPEEFTGRAVSIEGRLARLFRQAKFGEFPPLVEAWVVSPAGDPFCLVFPHKEGGQAPGIGAVVRFTGTFLKQIKYQGGDVDRLAPLIVGPRGPETTNLLSEVTGEGWSTTDWMMAAGASMVVGLILVGRHVSRPVVEGRPQEPPPSFVDGKSEREGDFDETGR